MNQLLGKKVGMTQYFIGEGFAVPVTVIKTGDCKITQIKSVDKEGFNAVQLGFVEPQLRIKHKKPVLNHLKKADASDTKFLREFKVDDISIYKLGDKFELDKVFADGDHVNITGTSIGRGFAGTTKRYGFHGGRKTHGSTFHRAPGSVGMCRPTHVIKGRKMPGHYGNARFTIRNLKIIKVDPEKKVILIKGGVPGPKNGYLIIKKVASKA